jgi:hypothetical protein
MVRAVRRKRHRKKDPKSLVKRRKRKARVSSGKTLMVMVSGTKRMT